MAKDDDIIPTRAATGKPFSSGDDERRTHGFQKGHDPRRHTAGQTSKKTLGFNRQLREMLVEEGLKTAASIDGKQVTRIQRVVERIYDEAEIGEAWAVQLIFERVDGKVTQPVESIGDVPVLVIRGASMDEV